MSEIDLMENVRRSIEEMPVEDIREDVKSVPSCEEVAGHVALLKDDPELRALIEDPEVEDIDGDDIGIMATLAVSHRFWRTAQDHEFYRNAYRYYEFIDSKWSEKQMQALEKVDAEAAEVIDVLAPRGEFRFVSEFIAHRLIEDEFDLEQRE